MENHRISELVKLEALGNLGTKDSAELLKLMQYDREFPWKEMGAYQNLAALFAVMVEPEIPPKKVKESLMAFIRSKADRELVIEDNSIHINQAEETNQPVIVEEENNKENDQETLHIKDPDLSTLDIFTHRTDFEEVKSRVSKIREQYRESKPISEKAQHKEERINLQVEKPGYQPKRKKSGKKILVLAASFFIVAVIAIGFMYFESSGNDIENLTESANKEHKQIINNSVITPKEQSPVVPVQNLQTTEQKNNSASVEELKIDDKKEIKESPEKNEINKDDSKTLKVSPVETPKMIAAPLEEPQKDNSETENKKIAALKDNLLPPPKEEKKSEPEPTYFVAVEEMPEPIGGLKEIQSKIVYPELARKAGVEGKVFILAFVDESGTVTKAEVIKGIGLGCDEAALNAVVNTKFKPGMQRGRPIKVQITIPITFKL